MNTQDLIRVRASDLRIGIRCRHPVYNIDGDMVLAGGREISQQILQHLARRGISELLVHAADTGDVARQNSHDNLPEFEPGSLADQVRDRRGEPYDPARQRRVRDGIASATVTLERFAERMIVGDFRDIAILSDMTSTHARELVDDQDVVLATATSLFPDAGIAERSVQLSLLGMAVSIQLGYDANQCQEVGVAGLLHDVGLFQLNPKQRDPRNLRSEEDWWMYQQHPFHTADILRDLSSLSPAVRLAVQQVHEHVDGTGFPRGVGRNLIHSYARILSVVDAYLTLTTPGVGQATVVPHHALAYLLSQGHAGRFEAEPLRALLNVLSLFPIGSIVELSDGTRARVYRSARDDYSRPIVIALGEGGDGAPIDLMRSELEIVRTICQPERREAILPLAPCGPPAPAPATS